MSNISHLSKILEKVVANQLLKHTNNIMEIYQSAYKPNHSTETALIRVCDDIKLAMDNKKGTVLVMIDLSAAFDTIDHSILLNRLKVRYGIIDSVLKWFTSYITGRTQKVNIEDEYSLAFPLKTGVPQGSVLGPLLFSLYLQPLGDIIRSHNLMFHQYADDLQLYSHFK